MVLQVQLLDFGFPKSVKFKGFAADGRVLALGGTIAGSALDLGVFHRQLIPGIATGFVLLQEEKIVAGLLVLAFSCAKHGTFVG